MPALYNCLKCGQPTHVAPICTKCEIEMKMEPFKVPPAGKPYPIISGVGKDSETVVNEKGGKQSKVQYRFDVLDPKAMFAMCKVLKEGYDKYGDDSNWRKIPVNEHLNHLLIHVYAYLAGDETDEHLSHAFCRAMFALAVDLQ